MKIAISGKGGVGKTTIAGMLSRLIGRRGYSVLAIDGDPNPNLASVLGIKQVAPPPLSGQLLERYDDEEGKRRVRLGIGVDELLQEYGLSAPDNVCMLPVGKPEHAGTGCMCSSHAVVREVVHSAVAGADRITILDMEASLEHMKRGTTKYVDALYIVVEPYYRSLEAGRRIKELAEELGVQTIRAIANKVRTGDDETAIREFCARNDLEVAAVVPYDEVVADADRKGVSVLEAAEHSPGVSAIRRLVDEITGGELEPSSP